MIVSKQKLSRRGPRKTKGVINTAALSIDSAMLTPLSIEK